MLLMSLAYAADLVLEQPLPDGRRLTVVLPAPWTATTAAEAWGRGDALDGPRAVLELRGPSGVLASLPLDAPLARLIPEPLVPGTWMVEADLSAGMGSYNGPVATIIDVTDTLRFATINGEPVRLMTSLKTAWRRDGADLLLVACRPTEADMITTFTRYHLGKRGWTRRARTEPTCFEFLEDEPFPVEARFPR